MSDNTQLNGKILSLEKAFKVSATSDLQRNISMYLRLLRSQRYSKLLRPDVTDNVDRLIGELRILEKLLSVLELGSKPTTDILLTNQLD